MTFGDTAPTVTVPSGARGALSYSATPLAVCTVEPSSGALTIVGAGDCEVTVTAAVTADYEVATAMFTVAVAKGAQPLTGFRYSAASVTFGDTAPAVTVPSGAQGALSYSATPLAVCTVGPGSGALTIVGAGDCEVTVTAAVTADYEVATAMFTVAVAKGAQPLTGFRYSAASVTFGDTAPAVTMPSGAQGALSYSATAPAVCTVDPGSGALTIVGVGDCEVTVTAAVTADYEVATAMFTVTVAQGDQTLSGFQYSSNTVTFGDTAPTVTAPSGAQTALSYSATPPAVCTVNPNSGVLTLEEVGDCEVTVTAVGTANYEVATAMFTVMVDPAGALMLKVNAIATDGTVNIAERAAGFAISGDTGSEGGVTVTVRVGTEELTATSAEADPAIWSVNVPGNAAYIVGSSVAVTVSAAKTGYTAPDAQTPTLTVDLMGPVAPTYAAPSSLRVGVALTEMNPTGGADIHEYGAPGLPSGLSIDAGSGVIGGTPDTANASTASVRVTVKDTAGNAATVDIAFPMVAKGAQTLSGFQYSANAVTFGDTAPTVTVPSGARGALSYSATPLAVCTVDPSSGALTIVGAGDCEVTVTAAVTADYEVATAMFTVAVAKGAQPLTGFRYSAASVTFGDTAPAVTVPSGAQGALSYSATPATVCTVGPRQRRVDDRGGGRLRGHGHGGGHGRLRGSHGDVHRDGGPGGSDAERVPIQLQYGDVRRYRADGDGAERGADGAELLGHAPGGVHGQPQQRRTHPGGGGRLRGHGHGGGHRQLRGSHGHVHRDGGPAGALMLKVNAIATDGTVNIAERAAGFAISGDTGSEGGVTVTVRVGTEELTATSAEADPAIWSVNVPGNAAYIVGSSVAVTVSAAKTGYTAPNAQTPTLTVDLMGPVAPTYAAPSSLRVGVALTEMNPTGGADIDEYGAPGLPSGLSIDAGSGVIGGTPDTADASTASVTVTVKDTAGNAATVVIAFPMVAKGAQTLSGFQYSASSVTFGTSAPTVTAPSGAQGALSYSAMPLTVCTVDPNSGVLTLEEVGDCEVTVTAVGTANYEVATAMFTVMVGPAGVLVLKVNAIATDGTVNIAEKAAGFAISGDTGSEVGVTVTVRVGTTDLTATSSNDDPAIWSVNVPGNAAYIVGRAWR